MKTLLAAAVLVGTYELGIQPAAAQQSSSSSSCSSSGGQVLIFVPGLGNVLSSSSSSSQSGCIGQFQQDILLGIVGNVTQSVRDQIHRRLMTSTSTTSVAPLRFTGEDSDFNGRDPFAAQNIKDPFNALAYGKVYTKAPPPAPVSQWIYGANLIGSYDQSYTFGNTIKIGTATGAFDVTKIGIFSATDALTFIGTGSGSWAESNLMGPVTIWNSSTPAASGTLSYLNGGFSADFTVLGSWTSYSAPAPFVAPTDNSVVSYTGNGQYRFDFPFSVFIEPTAGVTYTEVFTSNFGTRVADYTEVHGGARIGTEMKWMGYTIQPVLSGSVFRIEDFNVDNPILAAGIIPAAPNLGLGGRGSAKITVLWTPNFSSYIEGHTSGLSSTHSVVLIPALQTTGVQAGARYTW